MDNISFKSRIKAVSLSEFNRLTSSYRNNCVNYPWTVKESLLKSGAYTTDVYDCTVCGFTDGSKVLLLHICPTIAKNLKFAEIEKFITEKLDLTNSYLQGFLLGSRDNFKDSSNSSKVFKFFENFMKKNNIAYSKLQNSNTEVNVAYSSTTDEWIVASKDYNAKKTSKENLSKFYENIELSELDEFA